MAHLRGELQHARPASSCQTEWAAIHMPLPKMAHGGVLPLDPARASALSPTQRLRATLGY